MPNSSVEDRIKEIEVETAEIRRQTMELEFQHKKDLGEAEKLSKERQKIFDERHDRMQRQLDHLIKLVRITYDELDMLDNKLQDAGSFLSQPRERSTLS